MPKPPADGSADERERAVVAGVLLPNSNADFSNPLGELASLAESAGTHVVDSLLQKRMELSPTYAMGKGKLDELALKVEANDADVVIFDNDLTPRQIRALEKKVERKVIDRSELILDIFASRARTREAQLQVELAQLQYTAPRLRGMWTHLERIAGAGGGTAAGSVGGVGTRGPGERQIEIDRRIVKDRIAYLKRQIDDIDDRKQREVKSRGDQFTISLVGYTNSGKSTMMNKLTGIDRFAADMVFATLDTKTTRWDLGEGYAGLLSDTVGFIRNLPPPPCRIVSRHARGSDSRQPAAPRGRHFLAHRLATDGSGRAGSYRPFVRKRAAHHRAQQDRSNAQHGHSRHDRMPLPGGGENLGADR